MANTKPVNFRANLEYYEKAKEKLEDTNVNMSDIFNEVLRKVANGVIDIQDFISRDVSHEQYKTAFEELKKEILIGHNDIINGRETSLEDVRKEFGLD